MTTPYQKFVIETKPSIMLELNSTNPLKIGRELCTRWNALSQEERVKYENEQEKDVILGLMLTNNLGTLSIPSINNKIIKFHDFLRSAGNEQKINELSLVLANAMTDAIEHNRHEMVEILCTLGVIPNERHVNYAAAKGKFRICEYFMHSLSLFPRVDILNQILEHTVTNHFTVSTLEYFHSLGYPFTDQSIALAEFNQNSNVVDFIKKHCVF